MTDERGAEIGLRIEEKRQARQDSRDTISLRENCSLSLSSCSLSSHTTLYSLSLNISHEI